MTLFSLKVESGNNIENIFLQNNESSSPIIKSDVNEKIEYLKSVNEGVLSRLIFKIILFFDDQMTNYLENLVQSTYTEKVDLSKKVENLSEIKKQFENLGIITEQVEKYLNNLKNEAESPIFSLEDICSKSPVNKYIDEIHIFMFSLSKDNVFEDLSGYFSLLDKGKESGLLNDGSRNELKKAFNIITNNLDLDAKVKKSQELRKKMKTALLLKDRAIKEKQNLKTGLVQIFSGNKDSKDIPIIRKKLEKVNKELEFHKKHPKLNEIESNLEKKESLVLFHIAKIRGSEQPSKSEMTKMAKDFKEFEKLLKIKK